MSMNVVGVCVGGEMIVHEATMRRTRRRTRRAFSLLEITLVVAIIGVLMAVAAVSVMGGAERAKSRATKASMATITTALKSYHLDNSKYPETISMLVTAKPPFLEKTPLDGWTNEFWYKVPGTNGRPYDLISAGPDAELRTEDDINVWTMDDKAPTGN
jgi:general secretion pathway protein G